MRLASGECVDVHPYSVSSVPGSCRERGKERQRKIHLRRESACNPFLCSSPKADSRQGWPNVFSSLLSSTKLSVLKLIHLLFTLCSIHDTFISVSLQVKRSSMYFTLSSSLLHSPVVTLICTYILFEQNHLPFRPLLTLHSLPLLRSLFLPPAPVPLDHGFSVALLAIEMSIFDLSI